MTFSANNESEVETELLWTQIAIVHHGEPLSQVSDTVDSTAILILHKYTSNLMCHK